MFGPKAYICESSFNKNLLNIQKIIGNKNLMLVVKANAYGHGLSEICTFIKKKSNIILCVFSIKEACQIRDFGLKNKILIFSKIEKEWLGIALRENFCINLSCINDFKLIEDFTKKHNQCPSFHLKFDTGMTRLGFDLSDLTKVIKFLKKNINLPLEGLYTHFATADEGDLGFANMQLKSFKKIIKSFQSQNIKIKYTHCSNSGAVLNLPESYFNTVRIGMLAYGVFPSNELNKNIDLFPVMSFCGSIVNLRRVKKDTQISYGGVYKTKQETNIGVVQAGFADGVARDWYKKGFISYKGKRYQIAGRICMDQLMIDFENVYPKEGDEVLFFGQRGDDKISIEKIADTLNTTPYVLLTLIGGRTERYCI